MGSLPRRPNPRHTARPVKDRSTYPGSAATHEGRGGTLHHTVHLPPPAPRPAQACTACSRHAPCLRPRSASTEACLACPTACAGGQPVVAVLLVCAAGPSLDAGALRQYIAKPCKEGRTTAERQM